MALCHSLNVFTTPGTNNGMMPIMQENRNPHKYPQKYKNLKKIKRGTKSPNKIKLALNYFVKVYLYLKANTLLKCH